MICVIYTPRSGSKYFSTSIAEQYGYENLGEVFNTRTYPDHSSRSKLIKTLKKDSNKVFKLGVWQIADIDQARRILNECEQIYVCRRRNFDDQLKSFYAATAPNVDNYHGEVNAHINYDHQRYVSLLYWLQKQYTETVKLLEGYNYQITDYETFAEERMRYKRCFTWEKELPKTNIDSSIYFMELK